MNQPRAVIRVPVTTIWTSPDAPRVLDAPALSEPPDIALWMSLLDVDARLDLLGRVATQAIIGEPVVIVAERSGWAEVRLPLQPTESDSIGYPGWVPVSHLAPLHEMAPSAEEACISERLVLAGDHPDRAKVSSISVLSMGTQLAVIETSSDRVGLASPDAHLTLWVDANAVIFHHHAESERLQMPAAEANIALARQAEKFLGLPYLWGGLSGWGVDCSGLVHLAARSLGSVVSRDSGDQRRCAPTVVGENPIPDEVLFFRYRNESQRIHHVGIALNESTMIHAPRTGRVVEVLPLTTSPYAEELERSTAR